MQATYYAYPRKQELLCGANQLTLLAEVRSWDELSTANLVAFTHQLLLPLRGASWLSHPCSLQTETPRAVYTIPSPKPSVTVAFHDPCTI